MPNAFNYIRVDGMGFKFKPPSHELLCKAFEQFTYALTVAVDGNTIVNMNSALSKGREAVAQSC